MDRLYQDLVQNTSTSIHLTDFPIVNLENINLSLEDQINKARTITSLALSLRKKEQIRVRQPTSKNDNSGKKYYRKKTN